MKRVNYSLLIGAIIIAVVIIVVLFSDQIATSNPHSISIGEFKEVDGKLKNITPPFPPSERYLLGSDTWGRDLFSRVIYGARITLKLALIATLFRFIASLPLALLAGFNNKFISNIITFFNNIFSAIPALIFGILVLSMNVFNGLTLNQSIISFALVMTFVEWGRLSRLLENKIRDILNINFIKGQVAIGKNRLQITIQNILPHLVPTIIVFFFIEVSRCLIFIAQLGLFGIFVGNQTVDVGDIFSYRPEYFPEWGAMISVARHALTIRVPRLIIIPASVFFVTALGFNFLGEGLKTEVEKRNSMIITYLKRLSFHLSPITYIHELRNYGKYRRSVSIKTAIIVAILIVCILPPAQSIFPLSAEDVFSHVTEFSKEEYDGRMTGSLGGDKATQYILSSLENANISPLFNGDYVQEYKINQNIADIKSSRIYIQDYKQQNIHELVYKHNYSFKEIVLSKEKLTGEIIKYSQFKNEEYDGSKKYFIIIDDESLWDVEISGRIRHNYKKFQELSENECVEGILLPSPSFHYSEQKEIRALEDYESYVISKANSRVTPFIVYVDIDSSNIIFENVGKEVILENTLDIVESRIGKNIGDIIHGKKGSQETVLIVSNYDYLGDDDMRYMGLAYNASAVSSILEMAEKLKGEEEKPNKNIVFLFLDSSKLNSLGAKMYLQHVSNLLNEDTFIITTSYLGLKESETLYMDSRFLKAYSGEHYSYVSYMKKRAKELGIDLQESRLLTPFEDVYQFWNRKKSTLSILIAKSINIDDTYSYFNTKQNDLDLIDMETLKKHSQLILDTITYIVY